jgi:ABC-type multidrug transport system ATPase subunit
MFGFGEAMLVDARGLTKFYPRARALDGVSLQVRPGEIFGLFGPNGAGKTTCLRVLTGLTRPDAGWAQVGGIDILEHPNLVRRYVSILFDIPYLYGRMTFREYLEFAGRLGGMSEGALRERVRDILLGLGQLHQAEMRIARLSTGERQRVEVGRALMTDAPLLFLDEPFSNVDVQVRMRLRAYLREWLASGRSIIYTSHNLLEAEHFVDRFAFLHFGRIVAMGTARDLKERLLLPVFLVQVSDLNLATQALQTIPTTVLRPAGPDTIEVAVASRADIPSIARVLVEAGVDVLEMRSAATMEHVYQRVIAPFIPGGGA